MLDGIVTRRICPQVDVLKAEIARSERREDLRKELDAVSGTQPVQTSPSISSADPGAQSLATYLFALGLHVDVNTLSNWLSLVPVLALEMGSLFAGLLCSPYSRTLQLGTGNKCSDCSVATAAETPTNADDTKGLNGGVQSVQDDVARMAIPTDPAERLIQLLQNSGGSLYGGQRTIARAIGTSPASVNTLLRELEAGREGPAQRLKQWHAPEAGGVTAQRVNGC